MTTSSGGAYRRVRRRAVRAARREQRQAWLSSASRFMGSYTLILVMSIVIILWIVTNYALPRVVQFDRTALGDLLLLNMLLSMFSSYSGPIVLWRTRRLAELDAVKRSVMSDYEDSNLRSKEFLISHVAEVRAGVDSAVTRDQLRDEIAAFKERMSRSSAA